MKYVLNVSLWIFLLAWGMAACDEGGEGDSATMDSDADADTDSDTGMLMPPELAANWTGTITGDPPHFSTTGTFAMTIVFVETGIGYEGTLSCTDPGFSDDVVSNVAVTGNSISFAVLQPYYYDATVLFTGEIDSAGMMTGTWSHNGIHSGTWTASPEN
jgi:hypothetical protein